ncbi:MAG: hypothetical protein GY724_26715, partial [Actinomycetia bacterium]|nr:hypothetical protein [Actinomycetes bacterium]
MDQWHTLDNGGEVEIAGQTITVADVLVQREPKGDVVIETWEGLIVAFDTELTPELVAEGLCREVVSRVQRLRKDSGLEVTDRIALSVGTASAELRDAIASNEAWIASEVLATSVTVSEVVDGEAEDINEHAASLSLNAV